MKAYKGFNADMTCRGFQYKEGETFETPKAEVCESGPHRRPCKLEWVESIVDQCRVANVPVFVKQLDLNGKCERDITKFPEHLRIRQVPWNMHPAS